VTPSFKASELTCKCGCGVLPAQDFMDRIEKLRKACGFPFIVTSAARCPKHNAVVSGTGATGPHTTGRAIDIGVSHARAHTLVTAALFMGFTGIGVQQKGGSRFIHIDDLPNAPGQPRPTIWSY